MSDVGEGKKNLPLAKVIGQRDVLELTAGKDGSGSEGRSLALNKSSRHCE